jgi:hypothetical protein
MVPLSQTTSKSESKPERRGNLRHSNAIQQRIEVQRIVFETIKREGLKPAEVSGLARAWCDVNEEGRKQRMQPLPKSVDVSRLPKRGRRSTAQPQEPAEAPPEPPKAS